MIKISKKADYAVLIMAHLAVRQEQHLAAAGEGVQDPAVPTACAHEIAEQAGLSRPLTANLLKSLARADLLESVRGAGGGYRLGRAANEISLAQILESVEGPMRLVDCASQNPVEAAQCGLADHCPSRSAMRIVHGRIADLMQDIMLPELLRLENRASGHAASTTLS